MKCRLNLCLVIAVVFVLGVGHAAAMTPLIEAAKKGDTQKVQALLAKGEDVNAEDDETGHTALQWAAHKGHTDTVQAMLAEERVSTLKAQLASALGCAASKKGNIEIVQALLSHGTDVNAKNRDGDTALTLAKSNRNEWEDTKKLYALMAQSADKNGKDLNDYIASTYETGERFEDIVILLKKSGAREKRH